MLKLKPPPYGWLSWCPQRQLNRALIYPRNFVVAVALASGFWLHVSTGFGSGDIFLLDCGDTGLFLPIIPRLKFHNCDTLCFVLWAPLPFTLPNSPSYQLLVRWWGTSELFYPHDISWFNCFLNSVQRQKMKKRRLGIKPTQMMPRGDLLIIPFQPSRWVDTIGEELIQETPKVGRL